MISSTINSRWELKLKTDTAEITAAGTLGEDTIRLDIYVPSRGGPGAFETGDEHAHIIIKAADFDHWIALITRTRHTPPPVPPPTETSR